MSEQIDLDAIETRAAEMRTTAINIDELTKGFTAEPSTNAGKAMMQLNGYVLEITNYIPALIAEVKRLRALLGETE